MPEEIKNVTEMQASTDLLLPLRLVDIQATLESSGGICFIKPRDWSFHTVSHTWSQAVRDFSTSIGQRVTSAEAYEQAFHGAKLNEAPGEAGACYQSLMAFLRLLKEGGVKAIWIDALCINQTDGSEKDGEISRMGTYYAESLGCYVVTHGIGNGFKLWAQGRKAGYVELPRWFYRLWTLQEFLLSKEVTFIVEGLAKKTIYLVNSFIRQGGVSGLCECGLPKPRTIRFRAELAKMKGGEEDEIICSQEGKQTPCEKCERVQFIRKSREQPGVYFVDREAYCFLCQVDLGPRKWVRLVQPGLGNLVTLLWDVFALSHYKGQKPIFRCVESLRSRECTNEEDRVLGVLALLGVKPSPLQVRSGKTLCQQLLHLHEYCDATTFFKLCLMEPFAFESVGMSWAPILGKYGNSPFKIGLWDITAPFDPRAGILSVSQHGLRLEARVACGRLDLVGQSMQCPRRARQPPSANSNPCIFCTGHSPCANCTHWIRECDLKIGETYTFQLKVHALEGCCGGWSHPSRHMSIQDPWIGDCMNSNMYAQFLMSFDALSIHALKSFPVWLVLLGETDKCVVGMVCIGKDGMDSELHKIGVFACRKVHGRYDDLFFHGVPCQHCVIGGFDVRSVVDHTSSED